MDSEGDLIDNETFDFADAMLRDDDKENICDDDEVFFGPVTFKEKCKERWANDHSVDDFEVLTADMQVEDWCEIFTNANLVASTLMADVKKNVSDLTNNSGDQTDKPSGLSVKNINIDQSSASEEVFGSQSERRETFTLSEASLFNTPNDECKTVFGRRSAISDTSSYYTAQSNLSSPVSTCTSENDSPDNLLNDLKTPSNQEIKFELPVTPPTVKSKPRRSFLPTPQHNRSPQNRDEKTRRSMSYEEIRPTDIVTKDVPSINQTLRPSVSDVSVASTCSGGSRLRPPTLVLRNLKATRPILSSLAKDTNRARDQPSRLPAPSTRPPLRQPNSYLPRFNLKLMKETN